MTKAVRIKEISFDVDDRSDRLGSAMKENQFRIAGLLEAGVLAAAFFTRTGYAEEPLIPPAPASAMPEATEIPWTNPGVKIEPCNRIILNNGNEIEGQIATIADQSIAYRRRDGISSIVSEKEILRIDQRAAQSPVVGEGSRITFFDGSSVAAEVITADRKAVTVSRAGMESNFMRANIRALQFSVDRTYEASWAQLVAGTKNNQDRLVIKRAEGTLDYINGVVGQITPNEIIFLHDNVEIKAARSKVFGVVFYRPRETVVPKGGILLESPYASLSARDVALKENQLTVTTVYGEIIKLPAVDYLLDYSPGRTASLDALAPRIRLWNPLAGMEGDERLSAMFGGAERPIMSRQQNERGVNVNCVQLQGALEIEIPLRSRFSMMCAHVQGSGLTISTARGVVLENDQRKELRIDLHGVETLSLSVAPKSVVHLKDLYFLRE